jgi:hypothetical protein
MGVLAPTCFWCLKLRESLWFPQRIRFMPVAVIWYARAAMILNILAE